MCKKNTWELQDCSEKAPKDYSTSKAKAFPLKYRIIVTESGDSGEVLTEEMQQNSGTSGGQESSCCSPTLSEDLRANLDAEHWWRRSGEQPARLRIIEALRQEKTSKTTTSNPIAPHHAH